MTAQRDRFHLRDGQQPVPLVHLHMTALRRRIVELPLHPAAGQNTLAFVQLPVEQTALCEVLHKRRNRLRIRHVFALQKVQNIKAQFLHTAGLHIVPLVPVNQREHDLIDIRREDAVAQFETAEFAVCHPADVAEKVIQTGLGQSPHLISSLSFARCCLMLL